MNNEENKKTVDGFNQDSVDGSNVKGGFGGIGPMDPHLGGDLLPPEPLPGDPLNPDGPTHDDATGSGPLDPNVGGPIDPSAGGLGGPLMP